MKKKITINDIAKLAGVSKTTVSFYLNGKFDKMSQTTRARISSVIEKTDYQPNTLARSLNSKQTHLIGVIIGDITNSFANQVIKGIDDYCELQGYQMIVGSSGYELERERKYVRSMAAMGTDGFIVQPTVYFETMWHELGMEKPITYFDSPNSASSDLWVKTNNFEAVYEAVDELTRRGYDNYVMITANPYVLNTRMERYKGFTECLDERKLPYTIITADANTTPEELQSQLDPFMNDQKHTCVFVCNNWLLDKAYLVIRKYSSLIPEHIGLLGFDSLEWSELATPSITTIVQPTYEEGQTAAKILIDRIENRNEMAPNWILQCHTNELESTRMHK